MGVCGRLQVCEDPKRRRRPHCPPRPSATSPPFGTVQPVTVLATGLRLLLAGLGPYSSRNVVAGSIFAIRKEGRTVAANVTNTRIPAVPANVAAS